MKINKYKKLTIIIASLSIVFGLTGCSNKKNDTNGKDEIVIGYDNTFVPMGYLDENGETVGFDVDLAKETFKRMNKNIRFQSIDWSMKEAELNSGNIDVIWNGYTLTKERKEKVAYTDPYLENKQVIVTLKNSNINNKSDLKGKSVGTQANSSGMEAMLKDNEFVKNLKNKEPVLYDTYDKAFMDLEIGRIDALVVDESLAKYYISKNKDNIYNILNENFGDEEFVVATKKENTKLRDEINSTLKEIKSDGTFDEIYNKWFE